MGQSAMRVLDFRGALREVLATPLYWPVLAAPAAIVCAWRDVGTVWVFICSGIAVIPLAGLMGRATENLADTLGPGIGGLLNATFGNAAELLIGLLILAKGPAMYPLVKASITGSIIGNVLLVFGMSIVAGGLRHQRQEFNRTAASMGATLLALASIGLIMPTMYFYLFRIGSHLDQPEQQTLESLSEEIAVILAVIYLLSLVFSLVTHPHLFGGPPVTKSAAAPKPEWSRTTSVVMLLVATAGVAAMGELLVGAVEGAGEALGFNQVFMGVIVIATVGNAAEHSTAVLMAMRNKMDLVLQVAIGSSLQIALFVAPVLVFASVLMGNARPLDLHFTLMELVAVVLAVGVLALACQDGETHWMEGAMLLGVYVIIALAFYHLPVVPP